MKTKKKFIVAMGMMACMGMLSGCSKTPTAEELLESPFGEEQLTSCEMNVLMTFDLDYDLSSVFGSSDGESATSNIALNADLDIAIDEDSSTYTTGDVEITLLGMTESQEFKQYTVTEDGIKTTYSYDTDTDIWSQTTDEVEDDSSITELFSDASLLDVLESYEMKEVEKDDTEYVITGVITYEGMKSFMEGFAGTDGVEELVGSDADYENMTFDITLTYNRETNYLTKIELDIDLGQDEEDAEYTINTFYMSFEITQMNDVEVEVPDSVITESMTLAIYDTAEEDDSLEESTSLSDLDLYTSESDTDYTISESTEDTDYTTSESIGDSESLASYLFDVDYMYLDDTESVLSKYYTTVPEDGVISSITVYFNDTAEQFTNYLDCWDYMNDDDKMGIAILVDLGIFEKETITNYGVDSTELDTLLTDITSLYY